MTLIILINTDLISGYQLNPCYPCSIY